MALELPGYVQPETGTVSAHAYVKILDANLELAAHRTSVTAAIFHDKAAADAGKDPVTRLDAISLPSSLVDTPNQAFVDALAALVQAGKITSPRDALTACLYVLLKTQAQFSAALDV